MSALYVLLRKILHLLYPTRCPVCGDYIEYDECFCEKCLRELTLYKGNFEIENSDGFYSLFMYNDRISPAVILMKNGTGGNAPYAFAKMLSKKIRDLNADMIIPVPMYKSDKKKRGFNQTELISKELSRFTGIPVETEIVYKTRKTLAQKQLGREEREINLRDAFELGDSERITGKRIILLDDVCTTGSTLSEIAALLKINGAEKVYCVSCCKT